MIDHNLTLFTLFGFRVRANPSWLLLAALITWSLAEGLFPQQFPDLPATLHWSLGVVGMIGLFFSLLFHEFSHSLVARRRGMKIGGITLFLFGGVAELTDEPPTPRIEFEVAAAGPIASVFLALIFGLLSLMAAGWAPPIIGQGFWDILEPSISFWRCLIWCRVILWMAADCCAPGCGTGAVTGFPPPAPPPALARALVCF
nr:site-2 protease family protein [Iodidimonas gelatinilytica]